MRTATKTRIVDLVKTPFLGYTEVPLVGWRRPLHTHQTPWFTHVPPNLVTAFAGLLVPVMCLAFVTGNVAFGATLFATIALADGIDGALARYQERQRKKGFLGPETRRNPWLQRGETALGTMLDPFVDKVCYYAALIPLGMHALPLIGIAGSIGIALTLSSVRAFAGWYWRLALPSNSYGKIKVQFERATIASLVFQTSITSFAVVTHAIFLTAILLAAVSLLGQCWSLRDQLKKNRNP